MYYEVTQSRIRPAASPDVLLAALSLLGKAKIADPRRQPYHSLREERDSAAGDVQLGCGFGFKLDGVE